jgi:subtilisin family serine protease
MIATFRRLQITALATVLGVGGALATPAAAAAPPIGPAAAAAVTATAAITPGGTTRAPQGGAAPSSVASSRTVTLLTGDKVHVSTTAGGTEAITVEPAAGSGGVQTQQIGQDTYVIPDAALPYLAAGTLDRQLFNVTDLLADGYDDAHTGGLPLIVQYQATSRTARSVEPALPGAEVRLTLPSIGGQAVTADRENAADLWAGVTAAPSATARSVPQPGTLSSGISKIWLDGKVRGALDVSVPQIGAPTAWAAGFDGTGSTVAILDTGVDATHPDLVDAVAGTESFVPDEPADPDVDGHGTHVSSTVAGSGAASDGAYKGVAPGAKLLVGKVLDNYGYGQDSWIIAGMEWAASHAKIVSMSLGDPDRTDGTDPMAQALNNLSAQTGALFVVAAGNSYNAGTLGSPGTADAALTVAAVDDNDQRAEFSSQGPRTGDNGLKPDIAAPGVDITAARSQDAPGEGWYTTMSGTSMATPHVAGAAAIVEQAHPDWAGQRIKDALMSSTDGLDGYTPYEVGTGRLDVPAAIDGVDATGSVNLGYLRWGQDVAPVSKTVTYYNDTDTDVTLALSAAVSDADDNPVDLVRLSADSVQVPAHGSADVPFTADPTVLTGTGQFTGAIVGTAGAVTVRTAVALVKEDERYDLSISLKDRSGRPAGGYVMFYRYGDDFSSALAADPATGIVPTQRLAPGVYNVTSWLDVQGTAGKDSTGVALVGTPHLQITDADTSITLDARRGPPVTLRTPKAGEATLRRMQYFHDAGVGSPLSTFGASYTASSAVDTLLAVPTTTVPGARYEFAARWRATEPLLELTGYTPKATAIDPRYLDGSAHLDGRVRLDVVAAGTGTAAEYAGVAAAGKAVLVTRSDAVDAASRAVVAQDAGAALLVVVNDRPGNVADWAGGTDLPVVSLTAAHGAPLLAAAAKGRASIRGSAIEFPSYLYDVSKSWPDRIPTDLRVAPTARNLATVVNLIHGQDAGLTSGARYDCRDYQWPPCLGFPDFARTGSQRIDYVSTYPGNDWYADQTRLTGWEQRDVRQSYRAGSRQTVDWFAPVLSAHSGDGFWYSFHNGSFFQVNLPPGGGPGGLTGSFDWGDPAITLVSRLFQDGTLVQEAPDSQAVQTVAPAVTGKHSYRFEQDFDHDGTFGISTRSRSAWTFVADQADGTTSQTVLPLVQLDYRVATDLTSAVRRGQTTTLGLSAWLPPGAVGGGTVRSATLAVSYDNGGSWTSVTLKPVRGGGWEAKLAVPKRGAASVSLRASAWDDKGNKVTQTITGAILVR